MAAPHTKTASSTSKGKMQATDSTSCPSHNLPKSGHSPISCSKSTASSVRSAGSNLTGVFADNKPPVLLCGCKEPAATMISSTLANPNRTFLKCRRMNQAYACTCNRVVKHGCFLWVWEDRLEEYVKQKANFILEDITKRFMQEAAEKDCEIIRLNEVIYKRSQDFDQRSFNLQQQISKMKRKLNLGIVFFLVVLAVAKFVAF